MNKQLNTALEAVKKTVEKQPKDKALLFAYLNKDKITTEFTNNQDSMINLFYNLFTHHPTLIEPALKASQAVLGVKGELPNLD